MILHFKGGYHNNNEILPHEEKDKHVNAIKFKEFNNAALFLLLVNVISAGLLAINALIFHLRVGIQNISISGVLFVVASLIPHEIIHAMFFRGDVYFYTHHFALMITGTEPMSKARYIMMCLTPTIIFGFIPFFAFLINPSLLMLGTLGGISIAMGLGDFYNIFNCVRQVPKDGVCFMDKQNTYWYIPQNKTQKPDWRWNKESIGSNLGIISAIVVTAAMILFGLFGKEDIVTVGLFLMIEMAVYCLSGYFQIKFS